MDIAKIQAAVDCALMEADITDCKPVDIELVAKKNEYRNMSAQEFRHKVKDLINKEIFFGSLAGCAQTAKNADIIMELLAAMGWNQGYAA